MHSRSRLALSLAFTLVTSSAPALALASEWVPLQPGDVPAAPAIAVRATGEKELLVSVILPGFTRNRIEAGGRVWDLVALPGQPRSLSVGLPEVPAIAELIGIPPGTSARVEVVAAERVTLAGYRLLPHQQPQLEGDPLPPFSLDAAAYAADAFLPGRTAEVGRSMIWRDAPVAELRIQPLDWNPATGQLRACRRLELRLVFDPAPVPVPHAPVRGLSEYWRRGYERRLLNFDSLELARRPPRSPDKGYDAYDLLILAPADRVAQMTPLVTHKAGLGIIARIHTLDEVDPLIPSAADIRDFIRQQYLQSGITWVLLVGEPSCFPVHYDDDGVLSDLWFGLLEGDDLLPEVHVGRFPCWTAADAVHMADKTIQYETALGSAWQDSVLLVAHLEDAPARFQYCNEVIRRAEQTLSLDYRSFYPSFTTAYGSEGATNQDIIDRIDAGVGLVNYRGHGSVGDWAQWNLAAEYFGSPEIGMIDNPGRPTVVFSIACNHARLDYGDLCLGERFVRDSDGAVGALGASRTTYTTANQTFDQQLFAAIYDEGQQYVGQAVGAAAIRTMLGHGEHGERTARAFLWLGDPSLKLRDSAPPEPCDWLILMDASAAMADSARFDRAGDWAVSAVSRALGTAADRVALASYGGAGDFNLLVDWTRQESALVDSIRSLDRHGPTPLADAIYKGVLHLEAASGSAGARRLLLVCAGDEDGSSDENGGPVDALPNPPWCDNTQSWHCRTIGQAVGSVVVGAAYFGDIGEDAGSPTLELFLEYLAMMTDGFLHAPSGLCGNGVLDPGEECDVGYPCYAQDPEGEEGGGYGVYDCVDCRCLLVEAEVPDYVQHVPGLGEWDLGRLSPPSPGVTDTIRILGPATPYSGGFQDAVRAPDWQGWTGQERLLEGEVGLFADVWPALDDLDPFLQNPTPVAAFIDDGTQEQDSPGASCRTWCYGPGGFVVNADGGLAGSDAHIWNEIWSPPLPWPTEVGCLGALLEFDVYCHEVLDPTSPGLFHLWHVRSTPDPTGGSGWTEWRDRGYAYYGGPRWFRMREDVSALLCPEPALVQVALGVLEMGYLQSYDSSDAPPAPYFDNVSLKAFARSGPAFTCREADLAQDAFPAQGYIDPDLPLSNSVRFDQARHFRDHTQLVTTQGDSLAVTVRPTCGSELTGPPRLYYRLRANPAFDPHRLSGQPSEGYVLGDSCRDRLGRALEGRWCFDLPDTGFLFPGDVMHYYFWAEQESGLAIDTAIFPPDTTGFALFPGDPHHNFALYPAAFTFRALPTLIDASSHQPPILLWLDSGDTGKASQWSSALMQAGYLEGVDFDVFYTNDPSGGLGNGLGGMATIQDLLGYRTIIEACGDLPAYTLTAQTFFRDTGDDIGVLDLWLRYFLPAGLLVCGSNVLTDLWNEPIATPVWLPTWLPLVPVAGDLRPLIDDQAAPGVVPAPGRTIDLHSSGWGLSGSDLPGSLLPYRRMDAATVPPGMTLEAEFLDRSGQGGAYPFAAIASYRPPSYPEARIVWMPHDLADIVDLPGGVGGTAARTQVLKDILGYFGNVPSGSPTTSPHPAVLPFSVSCHPNPFNPRVQIRYRLPAAGRLRLRIYDPRGRLVRDLFDGLQPAGEGRLSWDGRSGTGAALASGVYFYRAEHGGRCRQGRVTLLR